jgi:hypothetical protein
MAISDPPWFIGVGLFLLGILFAILGEISMRSGDEMRSWWASTLWSRVRWNKLAVFMFPTLIADIVFYFYYPRPAVVGLLGDMYNFGAGIWFATDLLFKDRELERKAAISELERDIAGRNLPLTIDGVSISEPGALETVFNRRKAGETLSACLMLALGLTLVLIARLLEFVEQGKVEAMWRSVRNISF